MKINISAASAFTSDLERVEDDATAEVAVEVDRRQLAGTLYLSII